MGGKDTGVFIDAWAFFAHAVSNSMVKLSTIFSREKALFYFCMWDESDRLGYERFAGHRVRHNLFLKEEPVGKTSVWYANQEMEAFYGSLVNKLATEPTTLDTMERKLDEEWMHIGPYLQNEKRMEHIDDFQTYYQHLVEWWSAMTVLFHLPERPEVEASLQLRAMQRRTTSEKYTEKMSGVMTEFWEHRYPEYQSLARVITPHEAMRLARGQMSDDERRRVEARREGFGMLNGQVFLLPTLEEAMDMLGVHLEEDKVEEVNEVKGMCAYTGCVQGTVHLVLKNEDINSFQPGQILVTQMTNPNFVSAMKKAAAIVTDEGGVTCHAAIVAREFEIPCVVGTKIATKVLKGGERVEVDAEMGMVRKVK